MPKKRKTRKQKERAAKRREYLTRLAKEKPEVMEEIPKKEVPKGVEKRSVGKPEEVKVAPPVKYITLDFKKALILSGLFIAILVVLAILEAKYGFLGPLASRLMERLVR